jgi:NAD(P)-dependent dehydrogenase (short-subunit alcohol dehydrogenase family)
LVRVARVAALDRHPDGLGETVEMMSGDGTAAMAVTCDLTDEATVQRAVRKVVAEFRGLDGVVANAGAGGRCAMTDDGSAMRVDETLCGELRYARRSRRTCSSSTARRQPVSSQRR